MFFCSLTLSVFLALPLTSELRVRKLINTARQGRRHNSTRRVVIYCLLWTPAQRKRATMLYFANVLFIYLFIFMAALFSGPGERRFAKVLHVVDLECH